MISPTLDVQKTLELVRTYVDPLRCLTAARELHWLAERHLGARPGQLSYVFHNLLNVCPMQPDLLSDFPITHALFVHCADIRAKLLLVGMRLFRDCRLWNRDG